MIRPSNASKRFFAWWLMIVLCAMPVTTWGESIIVMATDGPLPAVVSADTPHDRDAAIDLCNYLSRIVGRHIEPTDHVGDARVVIHVGRDGFVREHAPEAATLFADGYLIRHIDADDRHHIILAGPHNASATYAVEQFLIDFGGVRFLFPDPKYGEVVPTRRQIVFEPGFARSFEPHYISRYNTMTYLTPNRMYLRGKPRFYQYGEHAIQHIFNNGAHSGEIFEKHPEWFAFFNGKRQWWPYGNGWQICSTNPGTVEHAIQHVLKYFEDNPHKPMVSIGNNDGWGECECADCTAFLASADPAYTVSERWWHWVNQVAREVKKHHPDKWVESLAYAQVSAPPRFALERNVAITKTFVLDNEIELAEKWSQVCESVNVYTYMFGSFFMGFRHYPQAAQDFLKWAHDDLGAKAHVTECQGDWTFDGPKYHYINALQWDVNADVDAVMEDFCVHSYGLAATPMRAFWDRLEQIYERRPPTPYGETNRRLLFYQWVSWAGSSYVQPNDEFQEYTEDDVTFLDQRMTEALRLAVGDDEGVQYRVARMDEAWRLLRTALISHLHLFDAVAPASIADDVEMKQALTLARKIADLRAERDRILGAMRMHPLINPRTARANYWGWFTGFTLFNHETTLLDELCFAITDYLLASADAPAALAFWRQIQPDDSLHLAGQTQIHCLEQAARVDHLVNGDFEVGDFTGWDVSGAVMTAAASGEARDGRHAARMPGPGTLSQTVRVNPRERYQLSAWARYLTAPQATAVPLEVSIAFHTRDGRIWNVEPARNTLRTIDPEAGWLLLNSTVTAPPGSVTAVIELKSTVSGVVLWDEVRFETIRPGVATQAGTLVDQFPGQHLDADKWFQSNGSAGVRPPDVREGWLIYDSEETYPITSYVAFNRLVDFEGEQRYRLRLRVAAGDESDVSRLTWGVLAGDDVARTGVTGMYWSHSFNHADQSAAQLHCHAWQGTQQTYNEYHSLNHLPCAVREVWYTLDFDRQHVTIYAAADGYEASAQTRVARYAHGLVDLASGPNIYLKINGQACRLHEVTLTTSAELTPKLPDQGIQPDFDPYAPIMPGVTDR